MNRRQYLLMKLAEECAEVAHIALKQLQFGKYSDNNGKLERTNMQHLTMELNDLYTVALLLLEQGEIEARPIFSSDKSNRLEEYFGKTVDSCPF